jgi:hypothetical protein
MAVLAALVAIRLTITPVMPVIVVPQVAVAVVPVAEVVPEHLPAAHAAVAMVAQAVRALVETVGFRVLHLQSAPLG